MVNVLHISPHLGGGVGRVLSNFLTRSLSSGHYGHEIICLEEVNPETVKRFQAAAIGVTDRCHDRHGFIRDKIARADIVHIHYWNHPLLLDFIFSGEMPPARIVFWSHVSGFGAPQVFTEALIDYADFFVISTPHSIKNEVITGLSPGIAREKIRLVFSCAGIDHVRDVSLRPHAGFNVGYIGTVNFYKMHPAFVAMSAGADIPGVKFLVAGGDEENIVISQVRELGAEDRFDVRGYVPDIRSVLEILDVFGYPLCREHYGTGEQSLIEALAAGIPAVVFDNGSERYVVEHGETGLVVSDEDGYTRALEYLYRHPDIRKKMSTRARARARERFDITGTVTEWHRLYDLLMEGPKKPRGLVLPESDRASTRSGAGLFLASLGPCGRVFKDSMTASDDDLILGAEEAIGELPPLFKAETRGSVLHYRRFHPEDSYLNLWSGLIFLAEGRFPEALAAFETAGKGIDHWRLSWYLGLAYEGLGKKELAVRAMKHVLQSHPSFSRASEKLARLSGK